MKTTTEIEIEVSKGRIIEAYVMPDGKCKLVIDVTEPNGASTTGTHQSDTFVKVEASKLSFEDEFMKHQPKTEEEQKLMEMIKQVIKNDPKDFWRPKYDPSFNKTGTGIFYHPGTAAAVGKTYNWWENVARKFNPECKSRLGTKSQYIAFLAVLIKKLVENGWTVANAWHAVCNDSKMLGHYRNSQNPKHALEFTGCREICSFFDLGNTRKILVEDEEIDGFWTAGGDYKRNSRTYPLADFTLNNNRFYGSLCRCGWLVFDTCPDHC